MTTDPDKADYSSFRAGVTYYFYSGGCKESFDKDPGKYIRRSQEAVVTRPGGETFVQTNGL
jgi:YHS domain-containing protein